MPKKNLPGISKYKALANSVYSFFLYVNNLNIILLQNLTAYTIHLDRLHHQLTMLESITTETQGDNKSSNLSSASPSESKIKEIMRSFYNTYANLLLLPILNEPTLRAESKCEINTNWYHVNKRLTLPEKKILACSIVNEARQLNPDQQRLLFKTLFPFKRDEHAIYSDINQIEFYTPLYEKLFHLKRSKSASTTAVKRQAITQYTIRRKAKLQSKKRTKKLIKKKANSKSKKTRIKQPPQLSTAESLLSESSTTEAILTPTIKTNTLKFNAVHPKDEAKLLSFSTDFFNQKSKQYEHETGELTDFEDPFREVPMEM